MISYFSANHVKLLYCAQEKEYNTQNYTALFKWFVTIVWIELFDRPSFFRGRFAKSPIAFSKPLFRLRAFIQFLR